jgi:hypothetical protein
MSSAEFVAPSKVFSVVIGPLVAGTAASAAQPNFLPGCSRVCGVVRTTSAGVAAAVSLQVGAVAIGAGGPILTLNSANAGDLSTYTLFWRNEVGVSMLGC